MELHVLQTTNLVNVGMGDNFFKLYIDVGISLEISLIKPLCSPNIEKRLFKNFKIYPTAESGSLKTACMIIKNFTIDLVYICAMVLCSTVK